jgi:hypothetical protein
MHIVESKGIGLELATGDMYTYILHHFSSRQGSDTLSPRFSIAFIAAFRTLQLLCLVRGINCGIDFSEPLRHRAKSITEPSIVPAPQSRDMLTEVLRAGAQKLLTQMILQEVVHRERCHRQVFHLASSPFILFSKAEFGPTRHGSKSYVQAAIFPEGGVSGTPGLRGKIRAVAFTS